MSKLEYLLLAAGALHFMILIASAMVPFVLDWKKQFTALHPFLGRLFWVYGGFIVLMIIGLGTLTLLNAHAMAAGDPVAQSLCAFIAIFWLARLFVQLFIFDARPFLTNAFLTAGYHLLTFVFIYFVVVYTWAAFF
ncbi:MAG: hypothetical protein ABI615_02375 [Chthoniobacterales bacterium]